MEFLVSPELIAVYLEDARGHLAALDQGLLRLERGHGPEAASAILGPLHTLKGNSGMLGLASIQEYVHRLEDVLGRVRDGTLALAPEAFDRLFAGASALREAVEAACAAGHEARDLGADLAALDGLLAPAAAPAPGTPAPAGGREAASPAAPRAAAAAAPHAVARSSVVRVEFARLDQLLNLVGELMVHGTRLQDVGRRVGAEAAADPAVREMLDAVHQMGAVSTQLQETIMDIRMLPIRNVFERFPRLVRDLARAQGKEIELVLEGEDTRVDKAIIDELGEPLVHMVRNSIDHGLERPEQRLARGKPRTGTLLLAAAQESNHVVITIADDGAGIDAAEVRAKAVARGLIRGDETLSDRDVIQMIFAEGFSTADAVTDLSGRGVGLDVVVRCMERLNGLIEAETIPGAGTRFTLRLPLTLAIIAVLLVEIGGSTYALPSGSVVESLRFERSDVTRINGRDTLRIRERIVPLVELGQLFGHAAAGEAAYAVVLGRGEKRLGVAVDRLRGQQQVVIKALDPLVSGAAYGVAGATIMGDGRVVLILDVASFFGDRRLTAPLAAVS